MARTCQACGLKNPDSAIVCDCGCQLRAVDPKMLAAAHVASHQVRSRKVVAYSVGATVALAIALVVLRLLLRLS